MTVDGADARPPSALEAWSGLWWSGDLEATRLARWRHRALTFLGASWLLALVGSTVLVDVGATPPEAMPPPPEAAAPPPPEIVPASPPEKAPAPLPEKAPPGPRARSAGDAPDSLAGWGAQRSLAALRATELLRRFRPGSIAWRPDGVELRGRCTVRGCGRPWVTARARVREQT